MRRPPVERSLATSLRSLESYWASCSSKPEHSPPLSLNALFLPSQKLPDFHRDHQLEAGF